MVLLVTGICCKSEPPIVDPPVREMIPAIKKAKVKKDPLRAQCKIYAAPVFRAKRAKPPTEVQAIQLPPHVSEKHIEPAKRRLSAMKAIDQLRARLKFEPREPRWHYMLARIHLDSLNNLAAAEKHFCRALLEAPKHSDYRLWVRAIWMREGQEQRLEESLTHRQGRLPWRAVLKSSRRLKGVGYLARAEAFMAALAALALTRRGSDLHRSPGRMHSIDLDRVVSLWKSGSKMHLAALLSKKAARKVQALMDRSSNTIAQSLWLVSLDKGQSLIHGRGEEAAKEFTKLLQSHLTGVRVRLSMESVSRRMFLAGRQMSERGFQLRFFAMQPRLFNLLDREEKK